MSVTAVPIPPVEKGALTKLWGGLALAVVVAGGVAWAGTRSAANGACANSLFEKSKGAVLAPIATASGLRFQTIKPGTGVMPTETDVVLVNYKGRLASGKEFDSGQRTPFPVQGLVPGFSEALKQMQRGGSYRICLPPKIGYGATANERIPANSTLVFDVDLLDFKSMAEVQAMQQQMQAQQGGGAGAMPQGVPHP